MELQLPGLHALLLVRDACGSCSVGRPVPPPTPSNEVNSSRQIVPNYKDLAFAFDPPTPMAESEAASKAGLQSTLTLENVGVDSGYILGR